MDKCFCHFNGYEVKDATARRNIDALQNDISELDGRVDQIANNQIPDEYIQASVDEYIAGNESGLATKTELTELYTLKSANAETIPANDDLNTYLTEGNYRVMTYDDALTIANIPWTLAGRLTVMSTSAGGNYLQRYITNSNPVREYVRFYMDGAWKEWVEIATRNHIEDVVSKSLNLEATKVDTITANDDFDNYKTPGNYKIQTYADATKIANIPDTLAGRLAVLTTTASTYVVQYYVTNSTTPKTYIRTYTKDKWNAWHRITLAGEIDTLQTNSLTSSNVLINTENYQNYFTDYNDIPINSVYNISQGVPLLNSPPGNETLNFEGETLEYPTGTVLTVSGNGDSTKVRSRMQIFTTSHPSTNQSILCFRSGYTSGGVLMWTPWQKYSEAMSMTASNIVIRKATASQFFTDLNDAPINSIYQLDLDCDEGTLANHPNPGQSCVLITFGFSHVSRHGMVQQCFGVGGDTKMFFRYGYKQSDTEYVWTPWKKVLTE